ncbi:MAG: type 4a pilus biogenesis protein PilO [Gemmatimonadaceae bacterium]
MSFLPKTQREQILVFVAVLSLVGAGAYWNFIFTPKSTELAERNDHLEQLVAVNQKARTELARGNLDRLRKQLAEQRAALDVIRTLVPTSNEVPALLEQVSTAARREGLELAGVDPQPVVAGDTYDTYRYDIGVVGGYHALSAFLANVGSLTRIVAPVNLKLLQPTNTTAASSKLTNRHAAIEARFQIQTFVSRKSAADDSVATATTETGTR